MADRKCAIRVKEHSRGLTAYRVMNRDTGDVVQVILCDAHAKRPFDEVLAVGTVLPQNRPTARRGPGAYPYMLRNGPGCRPGHPEDEPKEG